MKHTKNTRTTQLLLLLLRFYHCGLKVDITNSVVIKNSDVFMSAALYKSHIATVLMFNISSLCNYMWDKSKFTLFPQLVRTKQGSCLHSRQAKVDFVSLKTISSRFTSVFKVIVLLHHQTYMKLQTWHDPVEDPDKLGNSLTFMMAGPST